MSQERRLRVLHIAELTAGAAFLIFSAALLWRHPTDEVWLWTAIVWASTFAAAGFSIRNWHILWRASAESVAQYALAYEKRCVAMLRAARFGLRFLTIQLAIGVPWLLVDFGRGRMSGVRLAAGLGILACMTAGYLFWIRHQRRTAISELQRIRRAR